MEESDAMAKKKKSEQEQIIDHIRSLFEAYLRQDRDAIRKGHTEDWVGFQGPSTKIERGLDDYMKNAELSLENFKATGYELLDTEVQLYGDVAVVYYVARYEYRDRYGAENSFRVRAVDIYRRTKEGWNQAGSHITPMPSGGAWGEGA